MEKIELYNKLLAMVPVKCKENEDFRKVVKAKLKSFMGSIGSLDLSERPEDWDMIMSRAMQLCNGINRAIEREYQGMRHSAYSAIKNQLDGYTTRGTEIKSLAYDFYILRVPKDTIMYRMRKVELEEQHNLKRKDMFHIPLDMKGLVQTQRYSVPGFPCLYLANGVYGCWEEMGRPDFGTVMVSRFKALQDFYVLDLRVPTKQDWDTNIQKSILFFPFVIASMVQVKNSNDNYKPEYLIPQLLTEWIISHNKDITNKDKDQNKEIIGILYTSAQKNKDFSYPEDCFDNYAIPVLNPLGSKKYCKRLIKLFQLTAPTYYDLEMLKQKSVKNGGLYNKNPKDNRIQNYLLSHFGEMEAFIKDAPLDVVEE